VLIGARLGGSYGERFGVLREDSYRTGTFMVLAGIIGSRLTWVATHTDDIENPVDVIAIWEGGIQFSGGFIAALIVGYPMFRKWTRAQRWNVLNGYAWGLTIGMAFGRVGCYAVGEHFGRTTDFFLGTRYEGGAVREGMLGDVPLREGTVFHNTSLYEMITLAVLFVVMTVMILLARRKGTEVKPATLVALFMVWAGGARFLLDTLRVNDERFLSMTGAQWMGLVMVPYGIYLWVKVRPAVSKLVGPDGLPLPDADADADPGSLLAATADDDTADDKPAPDEVAPPEDATSSDEEPPDADTESAADADADAESADDDADADDVVTDADDEGVTDDEVEAASTDDVDDSTEPEAVSTDEAGDDPKDDEPDAEEPAEDETSKA
jgi:phosphatidylglycerol---prolipoprotein diacylglyceryl transferase